MVGFIGAYIGLWMAAKWALPRFYEINIDGKAFPIVWAIIGATVFTLIMALLRRVFTGRR